MAVRPPVAVHGVLAEVETLVRMGVAVVLMVRVRKVARGARRAKVGRSRYLWGGVDV